MLVLMHSIVLAMVMVNDDHDDDEDDDDNDDNCDESGDVAMILTCIMSIQIRESSVRHRGMLTPLI